VEHVTMPEALDHSCDEGGVYGCNVNGFVTIGGEQFTFIAEIDDLNDEGGRSISTDDADREWTDEEWEALSDARERIAREVARRWNAHEALVTAAREVVARWESGDLAEAVRALDELTREGLAETCSRCGGPLDDSGEGYADLCPTCADETEPDYDETTGMPIPGTEKE
jgi:NADH pyrophosphatase NudC (nudix superfamily)